jgi:hypothetical protein
VFNSNTLVDLNGTQRHCGVAPRHAMPAAAIASDTSSSTV